MGISPTTMGIGNDAALCLLLSKLAQGAAPPAQGQPPRARQAEFVICDQTIERHWRRLDGTERIAQVIAGARFRDGEPVQDTEEQAAA